MSDDTKRPQRPQRQTPFYRIIDIYERQAAEGAGDDTIEVAWPRRRDPVPAAPPATPLPETEAWPVLRLPGKSLAPTPGHAARHLAHLTRGALFVTVFDVPPERLALALRLIERQVLESGGACPIFLTDSPDTRAIRHAGFTHEYFPRHIYGAPEQAALFDARFRMLWKKWNGRRLLDLGAQGYLARRIEALDRYMGPNARGPGTIDPRLPRPEPQPPPVTDVVALKADARLSGLAVEADTFVLTRILGNDLPPRHEVGQTLANLRFILDHEPELEACEKRWVVNRIVDPAQEAAVIALLEERGQDWLHIPFDLAEYGRTGWDLESFFDGEGFFLRGRADRLTPYDRARAEAHLRRFKNGYLINNNGARNAALRDGRARAKWVLPWDGNCFLTEAAWAEIVTRVRAEPWLKHFVVPMARTLDNGDLLDPSYRPEADAEPQILFRRDSAEAFDESRHYGRRPKVEMFYRLGIPGTWDTFTDDIWDLPRPRRSPEAGATGQAGWVARLFSGQRELEGETGADMRSRAEARMAAVSTLLDRVDKAAMALTYSPERLVFYEETAVAALAEVEAGTPEEHLLERLRIEADLALQRRPHAVTDRGQMPPGGDPNDAVHPAPDGADPHGTRPALDPTGSGRCDPDRAQRLFDDITLLALGWLATGHRAYADHAAMLIRGGFLAEDTAIIPHFLDAGAPRGAGVTDFRDLCHCLDGLRLVERAGVLSETETDALRERLRDYLDGLLTSDEAAQARLARDHHGPAFDLQAGSIAAYLGDMDTLERIFRDSRERILEQIGDDGALPHAAPGEQAAHDACLTLQSFVRLAQLAEACGQDLWSFEGAGGRGIARALDRLLGQMERTDWPAAATGPFDPDRLLPLYLAARDRVPAPGLRRLVDETALRPIYHAGYGIPPFAMLAPRPQTRPRSGGWRALGRKIDRLERMAAALLQRSEPGVEDTPDGLERQLRLGLVEPARSRLAAMAEDETRAAACRAEAARALARWSFGAGDMATTRACLTSWARANSELPGREAEATAWEIALIDAWCADALGARDVALDRLHDLRAAGERLTDIDFAIAHCHRDTPDDWAARIDRLYRDLGLPGAFAAPDADAGCPATAPLVSVVVMDRPGAHGVEPALESLRAQTWTALDVMVVDRSDSAEERARLGALAASDARIRILSLPGDTDDCTARDHALGLARGRFVTVHGGDLRSHPMRIELQLEPLLDGDFAASLCEGVRVTPDRRLIPSWETAFRLVVPQPDSLLVDRDVLRPMGIAGRPLADSLEKAGHAPETVLAGLPLTLVEVTDARPKAEPVAYDTVFIATLAPDAPALPAILTRIRTEARSGRSVGVFHWPDATAQSPAPDAGVLESLIGHEVGLIRPHGAARAVRVVLCHPFAVLQPVAGLPDFRPERLEVLGGPELHAPPPGPMPRPRHLPSDEVYEAMFGAPPVRIAV